MADPEPAAAETEAEGTRSQGTAQGTAQGATQPSVVVKKYANRRLYNTETSSYITLDNLADMIRAGRDFTVYDAKSGEDITRGVLTQIIVEEESKGSSMLPTTFLRHLIGFYGDSLQGVVPRYLEQTMSNFARQQKQMRQVVQQTFGPFMPMTMSVEEVSRNNMAAFERAMTMFNPFHQPAAPAPTAPAQDAQPQDALPQGPAPADAAEHDRLRQEIDSLRAQLAGAQQEIEASQARLAAANAQLEQQAAAQRDAGGRDTDGRDAGGRDEGGREERGHDEPDRDEAPSAPGPDLLPTPMLTSAPADPVPAAPLQSRGKVRVSRSKPPMA